MCVAVLQPVGIADEISSTTQTRKPRVRRDAGVDERDRLTFPCGKMPRLSHSEIVEMFSGEHISVWA